MPGMFDVELDKEFSLSMQSSPVVQGGARLSLISLGKCRLTLYADSRLRAKVHAAVVQYSEVDYWISLAVYNEQQELLGAAVHKEAIRYIRLGATPTMLPELEFDFGVSNRFNAVSRIAAAISERDVPEPGQD